MSSCRSQATARWKNPEPGAEYCHATSGVKAGCPGHLASSLQKRAPCWSRTSPDDRSGPLRPRLIGRWQTGGSLNVQFVLLACLAGDNETCIESAAGAEGVTCSQEIQMHRDCVLLQRPGPANDGLCSATRCSRCRHSPSTDDGAPDTLWLRGDDASQLRLTRVLGCREAVLQRSIGEQREDQSNRSWAVQGGWRIKETRI